MWFYQGADEDDLENQNLDDFIHQSISEHDQGEKSYRNT